MTPTAIATALSVPLLLPNPTFELVGASPVGGIGTLGSVLGGKDDGDIDGGESGLGGGGIDGGNCGLRVGDAEGGELGDAVGSPARNRRGASDKGSTDSRYLKYRLPD